jgi:hypothetical protein
MLAGQRRTQRMPASSVAVYELSNDDGTLHYRYIGSTAARQFQLENWLG